VVDAETTVDGECPHCRAEASESDSALEE
jgi:hypothetical protein